MSHVWMSRVLHMYKACPTRIGEYHIFIIVVVIPVVYICIYTHICIYICICIYIYIHIYTYIHIYVYIYVHILHHCRFDSCCHHYVFRCFSSPWWIFVNSAWDAGPQGGEDAKIAWVCRSLSAKEPLIVGLSWGIWPIKIRHPMGLWHPVWMFVIYSWFFVIGEEEQRHNICVVARLHNHAYICDFFIIPRILNISVFFMILHDTVEKSNDTHIHTALWQINVKEQRAILILTIWGGLGV